MYLINKENNSIESLQERSFVELGFKERQNLQEWLAKKPNALGEDLLIIQKEFDGFKDTNERLDLLALDKQGDLVVIENKLDDSGRDVTWQALKYASYCSSLSKEDIRQIYQKYLDKYEKGADAEEMLSAFYDNSEYEEISLNTGNTQRIIMVAGSFRREVTSTVLWLMNFKIRIQCFEVSIEEHEGNLYLDISQMLPLPNSEDLTVGMASKAQDEVAVKKKKSELNEKRFEFWSGFLDVARQDIPAFKNISPSEYNWIGIPSTIPRVNHTLWLAKNMVTLRLYIDRGKSMDKENRDIYNELMKDQTAIHQEFGESLTWTNDPKYRAVIISKKVDGGYEDREDWDKVFKECTDTMKRMMKVFDPRLKEIGKKL
ncbi:DUF4268 domain-containing protein [Ekhidna sp. MALMAid0563]|uniref:DUF4268 domain-containing protein n=1 Tax=Ekhidna sp. MALMAid0563 TaxID=3143937 RepID=UPI0032DFD733